jgi:predicted nuclease with RNAse H fold
MLIGGLDLAAEPKGTAIAVIDWDSKKARLVSLDLGADDDLALRIALDVEKIGIDCALGWPMEFVSFLNEHQDLKSKPVPFDGDLDLRRKLAHRETDRAVREITGKWPLSVSTDRLGMTAIRCAGLLSVFGAHFDVDRSGGGKVVEVYPGAALRHWLVETSGYRNSAIVRARLIEQLRGLAPWLDLGSFQELMVESCDAFDSVFAALAARAAERGLSNAPNPTQLPIAKVEGWIHLPKGELEALL